jgi:hypothetical protein
MPVIAESLRLFFLLVGPGFSPDIQRKKACFENMLNWPDGPKEIRNAFA